MNLTLKQVQALQTIAHKGFATERFASAWIKEFCEYSGIGFVDAGKWFVTERDIPKLTTYLDSQSFGSKVVDGQVLNSRISTSGLFDHEKQAKPITHNRLFILSLKPIQINGQVMPVNRAFDVLVSEITDLSVSQIVIVENLEVFFEVFRYDSVIGLLKDDCLIVFRGDRCYSARAVQDFLAVFEGEVVGFFDFDPAGLSCLGMSGIQRVVVPSINEVISRGQSLTQGHLFEGQLTNYHSSLLSLTVEGSKEVASLAELMLSKHIAITQERLLVKSVELVLVDLIATF